MTHSINNKKENTIEPQIDSSNNQNMKTVKIILQKLSTQEINEPPKTKNAKSEQRGKKKSKRTTKNIYTPAILKKEISGTKAKFTFSTHKLLHKKKRVYVFHCVVRGCRKTFNKVKDWNTHHLHHHKSVRYKCTKCSKWFSTPTGIKDHKYTHEEKCFKCGRCEKNFYFQSGLNLHRNLHRRTKSYKCFAKNCKNNYKWPQDLMRHIKRHLDVELKCKKCDYVTHETRLFKQHERTHSKQRKYMCRQHCSTTFKHAMQRYRHERACK